MSVLFTVIIRQEQFEKTLQDIQNNEQILSISYNKHQSLELLSATKDRLMIRSFSEQNIIATRQFQKQEEINKIHTYFQVNSSYFFISAAPIGIFLSFSNTNKLFKATLSHDFSKLLDQTLCISFPMLYIFGGRTNTTVSKQLTQINLLTLKINLHRQDTYSPEERYNHLSYLSDSRMYIWGGLDRTHSPVLDNLLWTYDIEKSYWFALELSSPILMEKTLLRVIERQPNKLTLFNVQNCGVFNFNVYQSAVKQEKFKTEEGIFKEHTISSKNVKKQQFGFEITLMNGREFFHLLMFQKYEQMMKFQLSRMDTY